MNMHCNVQAEPSDITGCSYVDSSPTCAYSSVKACAGFQDVAIQDVASAGEINPTICANYALAYEPLPPQQVMSRSSQGRTPKTSDSEKFTESAGMEGNGPCSSVHTISTLQTCHAV
jgi:hypothetical protein